MSEIHPPACERQRETICSGGPVMAQALAHFRGGSLTTFPSLWPVSQLTSSKAWVKLRSWRQAETQRGALFFFLLQRRVGGKDAGSGSLRLPVNRKQLFQAGSVHATTSEF